LSIAGTIWRGNHASSANVRAIAATSKARIAGSTIPRRALHDVDAKRTAIPTRRTATKPVSFEPQARNTQAAAPHAPRRVPRSAKRTAARVKQRGEDLRAADDVRHRLGFRGRQCEEERGEKRGCRRHSRGTGDREQEAGDRGVEGEVDRVGDGGSRASGEGALDRVAPERHRPPQRPVTASAPLPSRSP
jgi:hypothetical protein